MRPPTRRQPKPTTSAKSAPSAGSAPPSRRELQLSESTLVGLLLVLHVAAALAWWHGVPLGVGPDEGSHLLFVRTLAGEAPAGTQWRLGLPVLQTGWEDPNFEVHQPPLYYAAAVLPYKLLGVPGLVLLSILLSALTVWLTWRLARAVAGPGLALSAAAVVALLPMQTYLASRVNNDLLANALWAALLWRWTLSLRDGPSRAEGLRCGVLLGLALLTKQTSLALLPMSGAVLLAGGWRSRQWRAAGEQFGLTVGLGLLLAGGWFLRNQVVYGDPFAKRAFDARFLTRRPTRQILEQQFAAYPEWRYWPYVWDWTVRSFVIYIDMVKARLPAAVYPFQMAILAAAAVGAVVSMVQRVRVQGFPVSAALAVVMGCGLVVVAALYFQFNQSYFQAQGRYFFGLLPAWGLLLGGGMALPFREGSAPRRYALLVAPLWFAFLNLALLTVYLPGLYDA